MTQRDKSLVSETPHLTSNPIPKIRECEKRIWSNYFTIEQLGFTSNFKLGELNKGARLHKLG